MEQNSVMVPLGAWHGDTESEGFYMVGRLLGRRDFNFEALKTTLSNAFNAIKGLDIRLIENGRLLFKFAHVLDCKRIIDGVPWAFEKNLFVLKPVENDDDPINTDLDWVDFSVHVHGLHIGRMSRTMAEFIGNQLGRFRNVEQEGGGQLWGSSLRIRVGLNVTKTLRRVLKLHTMMGSESTVTFSYKRLPNFCYWCGQLGHIMKFCDCQYKPGFDEKQDPLSFGSWLCATTPSFLRSRGLNAFSSPLSFAHRRLPEGSIPETSRRGPAIFQFTPPTLNQTSTPPIDNTTTNFHAHSSHAATDPISTLSPHPTSPYTVYQNTKTLPQPSNSTSPAKYPLISHNKPTITLETSPITTNPLLAITNTQPLPYPSPRDEPTRTSTFLLNQALTDVPLVFSVATQPTNSISQ
ncbi:hypothetical protein Salat_1994100 [Sesamum alatum]|uniref:CCHC-type domain-containing protein n=1 Tax=Sesamum alatum TaxID=300844 RepID=A0AAE2CFP9_9LAMI|nr:hypothetical protein Salat_1994100 [Sesamum alatum]